MDVLTMWGKHQGLIHKIINQFDPQYHDDLLQEAYFVLTDCIRDYDKSQYAFTTLLSRRLKWHCMAYVDEQRLIRLPAYILSLKRKYRHHTEEYSNTHNREPTDLESMDYLGITAETLSILKGVSSPTVSLDDADDYYGDPSDTISDYLDQMSKEQSVKLWDIIEGHTTEREAELLVKKYRDSMDMENLSSDMGISKQRCYVLEINAMKKLRRCTKLIEIAELYDIAPQGYYQGGYTRWKNSGSSCVEKMAINNCE